MAKDVHIPMGVGGWEAQNSVVIARQAYDMALDAWRQSSHAIQHARPALSEAKAAHETARNASAAVARLRETDTARAAMQKAADAYATARNLEGRISALEQKPNLSRKSKRK